MARPELPRRYVVSDELGAGAFGRVFRAWDRELGIPVAVKVPYRGADDDLAQEVAAELRAGATVRHPAVVQMLDAGTTGQGAPFLVMEFAGDGSLQRLIREGPPPWPELLQILDAALAGLGHLHALGLVHRDIKGDNVLLSLGSDGRLRPKIADFGLAKVQERRGGFRSTRLGAGSLLFMPPEVLGGEVAGIHPGADLYAFGVLIYQLVGGRPPWQESQWSIVAAKLMRSHQPLEPREGYEVPADLARVVDRMLARRPAYRYALAADVRRDLASLADVDDAHIVSRCPPGVAAPPSFPERPSEEPARSYPPSAAVATVRTPPLVGRSEEQAALWAAASRARTRAHVVALAGPDGAGKSRLCTWLRAALQREGLARTLRVRLEPELGAMEALERGLRRFLHLDRLEEEELRRRLGQWYEAHGGSADDVALLLAWFEGAADETEGQAGELIRRRLAAIGRLLRLEAARGLVCVWLEENGARPVGVPLREALLRSARADGCPLLLLHELPPGAEADEPRALALGPLPDGCVRDLLEDLVPPGRRFDEIVVTARGNPLVVVESARLLAARPIPDEPTEEPVDETRDERVVTALALAAVRVDLYLARPEASREDGLLLALLGLLPAPCPIPVLEAAWSAAAGPAAPTVEAALREARIQGLVSLLDGDRVEPSSAALADAARKLAEGGRDPQALRAACAEALLRHGPASERARAGDLLLAAGQPERGLPLLVEAAEALLPRDPPAAGLCFQRARDGASTLGLPPTEPTAVRLALGAARAARNQGFVDEARRLLDGVPADGIEGELRGWLLEARASVNLVGGDFEQARRDARSASDLFEGAGQGPGLARARLLEADAIYRAGQLDDAVAALGRAGEIARRVGDDRVALDALWREARVLRQLGRLDAAREGFDRAVEAARAQDALVVEGIGLRELGNLCLLGGDEGAAEQFFGQSIACFERSGSRAEVATTRNSLGELARARGRLAEARGEYAAALGVAKAYGLVAESVAFLVNLAITELEMDRVASAQRRVREIDRLLPRGTPHRLGPYVEGLRAAVAADGYAWETAEEGLSRLIGAEGLPRDPDLVRLLVRTGRLASQGGQPALALDAWDLVLAMAHEMGDEQTAQRAREALAGL